MSGGGEAGAGPARRAAAVTRRSHLEPALLLQVVGDLVPGLLGARELLGVERVDRFRVRGVDVRQRLVGVEERRPRLLDLGRGLDLPQAVERRLKPSSVVGSVACSSASTSRISSQKALLSSSSPQAAAVSASAATVTAPSRRGRIGRVVGIGSLPLEDAGVAGRRVVGSPLTGR